MARAPAALGALLGALAVAGEARADGATIFAETCAACHGDAGVGAPGLAPPLDLADFWAALGDKGPDYLAGVLAAGLSGRITAAGVDYIGLAMPAQPELSDADAAEVATYVLATLGGQSGAAVSPEVVAGVRAAPPSHADLRATRKGG